MALIAVPRGFIVDHIPPMPIEVKPCLFANALGFQEFREKPRPRDALSSSGVVREPNQLLGQ